MNDKEMNLVKDIIKSVIMDADQALQDKNESSDDFERGKVLAYNEVLSTIKNILIGYDLEEFGLNFDIDQKYL